MSCVHLCTGEQAPFLPCSWGEGPPPGGGALSVQHCSAVEGGFSPTCPRCAFSVM